MIRFGLYQGIFHLFTHNKTDNIRTVSYRAINGICLYKD